MKASENKILKLIEKPEVQFSIPVYQRNYDWQEKHCKELLDDILKVGRDDKYSSHFIGSIVYIEEGIYLATSSRELSVIDGQQRLTTITLLLAAIAHKMKEFGDQRGYRKYYERYLTDEYLDSSNNTKLLPPSENLKILIGIVNEDIENLEQNNNFIKNYKYFVSRINNSQDIKVIENGLQKLMFVEISLERGKDDPQRIFESLNSTGLDLSQGDLIRNYILMDLNRDNQNKIYDNYWSYIENNCRYEDDYETYNNLSDYIRDYLTFKTGKIPNKNKVFEEFKNYSENQNFKIHGEGFNFDTLEEELKIIREYSYIYAKIMDPSLEKDKEVSKELYYLNQLEQKVITPFLLGIYRDYTKNIVTKEIYIKVLQLLQSFLWRRYVTEEPTNALNKIFMNLYSKIDKENIISSLENHLLNANFPSDEELKGSLRNKNLYKERGRLMYLFEKIENYNHKETIAFDNENITIEHIFPQRYSENWKTALEQDELDKMLELKDTLANLTLTGSNSNLGNKTFLEKRDMELHGFRASKLEMNKWLAQQNVWNLQKLEERLNLLFNLIKEIFPRPKVEREVEDPNEIIFICKGKTTSGRGKMYGSKKFLVLKDSTLPLRGTESYKEVFEGIISGLLAEGVIVKEEENYRFIKNHIFSSGSAAANSITGRFSNGNDDWKTFEGKKLKEFKEEKEE